MYMSSFAELLINLSCSIFNGMQGIIIIIIVIISISIGMLNFVVLMIIIIILGNDSYSIQLASNTCTQTHKKKNLLAMAIENVLLTNTPFPWSVRHSDIRPWLFGLVIMMGGNLQKTISLNCPVNEWH